VSAVTSSERDKGHFGDAVDANRSANGPDPDIGIQGHVPDFVESPRIFSSQGRQPRSSNTRNPDLPSVRVTGELKISRRQRCLIREIGFVGQQNKSFAGRNVFDGCAKIWSAFERVIDPSEPETLPCSFNRHASILEHKNAVLPKGLSHHSRIGVSVMVTENGKRSVPRLQGPQDLGARDRGLCGLAGSMVSEFEQRHGNEIASENDQVRMKIVYQINRVANGDGRKSFFIMKIAELNNSKSVKLMRQALQGDFDSFELKTVGFEIPVGS